MMGKWVAAEVLDGALQVVANANRMLAVSGQPMSYGAALGMVLAEAPMAAADFGFTTGDTSGRKIVVGSKVGVDVITAGVANHVALVDVPGERLLYVTTCPPQALVAGGKVTFDPWSVEISDPS